MSGGLTQAAYARHRQALGLPGASRQGVGKAVRTGRIELGDDGLVDADEADRQWSERTNARLEGPDGDQVEGGTAAPPPSTTTATTATTATTPEDRAEAAKRAERYRTSRAEREHWNAERARVAFQRSSGDLIDRTSVRAAWAEVLRRLRESALALPIRASVELLALVARGEATEHTIRMILEREVAEILRSLSDKAPGLPDDDA